MSQKDVLARVEGLISTKWEELNLVGKQLLLRVKFSLLEDIRNA